MVKGFIVTGGKDITRGASTFINVINILLGLVLLFGLNKRNSLKRGIFLVFLFLALSSSGAAALGTENLERKRYREAQLVSSSLNLVVSIGFLILILDSNNFRGIKKGILVLLFFLFGTCFVLSGLIIDTMSRELAKNNKI